MDESQPNDDEFPLARSPKRRGASETPGLAAIQDALAARYKAAVDAFENERAGDSTE